MYNIIIFLLQIRLLIVNFDFRSLYIFRHFGLQKLAWDCCKQPHHLVDTLQRPSECSRRGQCVPRSWRQHHWLVTEGFDILFYLYHFHLQSLFSGKVHRDLFSNLLIFRVAQHSWHCRRTWAPSFRPQHYWSLWALLPSKPHPWSLHPTTTNHLRSVQGSRWANGRGQYRFENTCKS